MSKAFTRESDEESEWPALPRQVSPLPPGAKNYLTPGGAQRLREELERLLHEERPKIAAEREQPDARRQLQAIDQKIRYLEQSALSAVIVAAPAKPWDQVRFGATVTVRNKGGAESKYRIVGVDETDLARDWVSWLSPIAKALLNARLGERVVLKLFSGDEELEVMEIEYE